MALGIRTSFDNVIATVEAAVADTEYSGVTRFRYAGSYDTEDAKDGNNPTRVFLVTPTGRRSTDGWQGTQTEPMVITQTLELTVYYLQGLDPTELLRVLMEDVDRLGYELERPAGYDQENTGLWRRAVGGYVIDLDKAEGGTAVLTLPVELQYTPTLAS
jgi:hypothetical protein